MKPPVPVFVTRRWRPPVDPWDLSNLVRQTLKVCTLSADAVVPVRQDAQLVPASPSARSGEATSKARRRLEELRQRLETARQGGGPDRIDRQHERGKLTARERLSLLADPGSLAEIDALREPADPAIGEAKAAAGDGVVTATATVDERPVAVYAQDFTVQGGSLGTAHADKIAKVLDRAIEARCPVVGINDSGGARIQEGIDSLAGYSRIFHRNVQASGLVPQITIVAGPCAGGAVYSPALTDLVIMVDGPSRMFLTGPRIVETVTGEQVTSQALGGARVHARDSGVAHLVADDEHEAIDLARRVLSYLPRSAEHPLPVTDGPEAEPHEDPVLDGILPDASEAPYDVVEVVRRVVDGGRWLEIMPDFASNLRTGLARLGGVPVGVLANDPRHLAGTLDIDASTKGARFVRFCDAFNLPLVTFVDVPGFLPGTDQEHGGVIRHGAKLVHAYAEASVPTLTCVLRKAYGGAYIAMSSKNLGADVNLAWPTAEIAVMGSKGAVGLLHRKELERADDPDALEAHLREEYEDAFANPYQAAGAGYIDAVIEPRATRPRLITALARFTEKRSPPVPQRHRNPPL